MEVAIHGHNVEVPEDLRSLVAGKVTRLGRFLEGIDRAEVRFLRERNPRIADKEVCEITVSGQGRVVRARAQAGDALAAVDRVLDKLEHRMEKVKGRLASRSHPHHRGTVGTGTVEDAEVDLDGSPQIVRVARSATKPMTPEEATLQLDLQSLQFCFFTNAETGRAAVVYRRGDGRFGLMDSS